MLSPAVLVVPYISILINLFMHEHVKSEKICPGWIGEFEDSTEPNSCRDDVSTCSCKDNEIQFYEETRVWVRCHFDTASIKWYGIPKENIDVLQNYSTIEIEDCSIPEESIKDILPQLRKVEKVEELNIHSIYDRNNETYRNMHFKNLDFVKNMSLTWSDFTSLPEDVFDGLWNVLFLDLEHNKLEHLPGGIFKKYD